LPFVWQQIGAGQGDQVPVAFGNKNGLAEQTKRCGYAYFRVSVS
jgi:hypothetical protein